MSFITENRLIAVIIVLVIILLVVLAYAFWKRDGGKPAERASPYRSAHEQVANGVSREELEKDMQQLEEEDNTSPPPAPTPVAEATPKQQAPRTEPPAQAQIPVAPVAEPEPADDGARGDTNAEPDPPPDTNADITTSTIVGDAAEKKKCSHSRCTRLIDVGREFCWQHAKKSQ